MLKLLVCYNIPACYMVVAPLHRPVAYELLNMLVVTLSISYDQTGRLAVVAVAAGLRIFRFPDF